MNLSGLVIASLLSMSDLTVFLDRLTIDGHYKCLQEHNDEDDAHAYSYRTKNSFMPRLVDLSFGKYAMFILRKIYVGNEKDGSNLTPFDRRTGLLQVLLQNYGECGGEQFKDMLLTTTPDDDPENAILLIPIHPEECNKTTNQLNLYYLEF